MLLFRIISQGEEHGRDRVEEVSADGLQQGQHGTCFIQDLTEKGPNGEKQGRMVAFAPSYCIVVPVRPELAQADKG